MSPRSVLSAPSRLRPRSVLLLALCAGLPGCATQNPVPDEGAADLSVPSAGGGGDALPVGAIAFFKTPLCPNGWFPYLPAVGRFLVPTGGAGGLGETLGKPLAPREDRAHGHALSGKVELRATNFAGIVGEANHNVANAGTAMWTGQGDPTSLGLPYLQLLVCQKSAPPRASKKPVPRGALAFFAQAPCPPGWVQANPTQGRHPVGLPDKGAPDKPFGGAPLGSAQAGGPPRKHSHTASGNIGLPGAGIGLASGCCANGYAAAGDYAYTGATDEKGGQGPDDPDAVPHLRLLQCQKL